MTETSSSSATPSLSYKDAGVDIDAGNALVDRIKHVAKRTTRPEVMGGLGGFGALCEIPAGYRQPVLVSGTDGVGTKLRLAMDLGKHDTIGIDLVAMCVNDLIVLAPNRCYFLTTMPRVSSMWILLLTLSPALALVANWLAAPGRRRNRRNAGYVRRQRLRFSGLLRGRG